MREIALLFVIVVGGTSGEMCMSYAMKKLGLITDFHPLSILRSFFRAARLPAAWCGVTLMAAAFFSLLALLSIQEVSFAVPTTALSYVTGAIGSTLFLGERISRERWLGLALVCVGVTVVWMSKH